MSPNRCEARQCGDLREIIREHGVAALALAEPGDGQGRFESDQNDEFAPGKRGLIMCNLDGDDDEQCDPSRSPVNRAARSLQTGDS